MNSFFKKLFGKKEKVEPPDQYAIVKLNEVAKESAVYDDENKIIELHKSGKVSEITYSEADVDSLREQGIPVIDEEYTDEYDFLNSRDWEIETRR